MTGDQEFSGHADLDWDEQGQPLSSHFGDVYFSKANGLQETRHVFLHHNHLEERWRSLAEHSHFVIGETGFGSGLNFLAAWELWIKTAPATAQLHFVTLEKYPLRKTDLVRAHNLWPELSHLAGQLIQAYPVFVGTGFHRLRFMDGRVQLTILIDDAATGLGKLIASPNVHARELKVDAWFLDGFAPAKNPQMWSDDLFDAIGQLSGPGTTAATFSAAAIVKQGLKRAGFDLQKVPGFGRKREMVKAVMSEESAATRQASISAARFPPAWFVESNTPAFNERRLLIVGGGLAGCHTARAMAERGWRVELLEAGSNLALHGSGNPQGVLYAKLSPRDEAQGSFNLACLQYAQHFYQPIWPDIGDKCGVLQLAHREAEQRLHGELRGRFQQAQELVQFVDAETASKLGGTQIQESGLFFPEAGWIDPRRLCHWLVNHPRIQVRYQTEVESIQHSEGWEVTDKSGQTYKAPVLVIATASQAIQFPEAQHLPFKAIRGQITYLPHTHKSPAIRCVICAEGYVAPAHDGKFCTGATFNLGEDAAYLRDEDQETNLANLKRHLPDFENACRGIPLAGRVGFRCSLPDYLPAVGPLPDLNAMLRDFAPLRNNAKARINKAGSYIPGLYINSGHGARGLAYTPLCAQILAAWINNEPMPLARDLVNALNPARFIIRDLIRNKR